jgi:hypothetical protein
LSAGATTIALDGVAGLSVGDEILVIQMQAPTAAAAGTYELATIAAIPTSTSVQLTAGLAHGYVSAAFATTAASATQVVRVVSGASRTIAFGETVTAPAWNGYTGGVVALRDTGTLTVNGKIDVAGLGFRGGTSAPDYNCALMPVSNGYAGESWGGLGSIGTTGNGGAGGAGNSGQCGFGPGNYVGAAGGGGGAYGGAAENRSAYTLAPQVVPGARGTTYGNATLSQLYLGSGGGGGGAHDVGAAAGGGAGGGIVFLIAPQLTVGANGSIDASGANALSGYSPCGAGGGGSGGSISISTTSGWSIGTAQVKALGGAGGTAVFTLPVQGGGAGPNDAYRQGGSGGTGRIALVPASGAGTSGTSNP